MVQTLLCELDSDLWCPMGLSSNDKIQMSNQVQNPNVKMFSKTISYLSFSQHINKSGYSGCFPLLQKGDWGLPWRDLAAIYRNLVKPLCSSNNSNNIPRLGLGQGGFFKYSVDLLRTYSFSDCASPLVWAEVELLDGHIFFSICHSS